MPGFNNVWYHHDASSSYPALLSEYAISSLLAASASEAISTKSKLQGVRVAGTDYCVACTRKNIDTKLSHVKDQLNALLKANNVGVALKEGGLPST